MRIGRGITAIIVPGGSGPARRFSHPDNSKKRGVPVRVGAPGAGGATMDLMASVNTEVAALREYGEPVIITRHTAVTGTKSI